MVAMSRQPPQRQNRSDGGEPRTLRGAPNYSIAAILQLPENKYDKLKWIGLTASAGVLKSLYVKNCGNP
jgi:hypothetical protein